MDKIRVLHVLEATLGGTRRHLLQIARNIDRNRFELGFVLSVKRDPETVEKDSKNLRDEGFEVFNVELEREVCPMADIRGVLNVMKAVRAFKPRIVHTHASKGGILGRLAAKLCGVPLCFHTPHLWAFSWEKRWLRSNLYRLAEKFAGTMTNEVLAVSDTQYEQAARAHILPVSRIHVLKNTVEPPPSQLRRSPPTDKWTVGTAARLMHQKGLDTLIRAFAEFHVKVHDSRLLIAGEGPLEEDLKAMAARLGVSGSVEFVGHVDDIYEFFVSLHLFAMPSRWEGYPYTLLEAMSAGVPVVASDIPGISEALFHEFNGLLFAPDDERALAKALTRAHGEPRLLSSLAANARDMVACDGPEEFCRKLEYRYIRATEQFAGFHG